MICMNTRLQENHYGLAKKLYCDARLYHISTCYVTHLSQVTLLFPGRGLTLSPSAHIVVCLVQVRGNCKALMTVQSEVCVAL